MEGEAIGGDVNDWLGAEGGAAGIDKSRRSFKPELGVDDFGGAAVANDVKDERSEKPLVLELRCCGGDW
jgi:hypothetical protein